MSRFTDQFRKLGFGINRYPLRIKLAGKFRWILSPVDIRNLGSRKGLTWYASLSLKKVLKL